MDPTAPFPAPASTMDIDCFTSCVRSWPPCPLRSKKRQGGKTSGPAHNGSCWTLDWSGIDYGHQLLHIMRQGLASLPAAKRKKARRKKLRPRPQCVMLDPRLVRHRLRTSTTSHHAPGAGLLARCEAKKGKEEKPQAPPTMCHAGPSTNPASNTDIDYCTSCARGWPPCPLRSEKRQGGKNSGPARNVLCWTLDWSGIDYGHRLLSPQATQSWPPCLL